MLFKSIFKKDKIDFVVQVSSGEKKEVYIFDGSDNVTDIKLLLFFTLFYSRILRINKFYKQENVDLCKIFLIWHEELERHKSLVMIDKLVDIQLSISSISSLIKQQKDIIVKVSDRGAYYLDSDVIITDSSINAVLLLVFKYVWDNISDSNKYQLIDKISLIATKFIIDGQITKSEAIEIPNRFYRELMDEN